MPSSTPINVPVFVFRSKHTGPVVLLQAGMHNSQLSTTLQFTSPSPTPSSSQTDWERYVERYK